MKSMKPETLLWVAFGLVCLALGLAGCGGDETMVGPTDPLADVYGRWSGTIMLVFVEDGDVTVDHLVLKISAGPVVTLTITATGYAVLSAKVNAGDIDLVADVFGNPMRLVGDIDGDTMTGSANIPGIASGTWTVSK